MKKYIFLIFVLNLLIIGGCVNIEDSEKPSIPTSEPATEFVEPDPSKIVQDPDTGINLVKDELLISFLGGVTETERLEIINAVGGIVIAIDRDFDEYQVRFPVDSIKDLYQIENQLEQNPKVESASPVYFEEPIFS